MADGIKDIIASLEKQRVAIERALEALKEVDGSGTVASSGPTPARRGPKPGPRAKKTAPAAKATRKGRISEEGRRKLAEAMSRRWAAKRADSTDAKPATKKGTRKKAA
jgi:hypothetical protein